MNCRPNLKLEETGPNRLDAIVAEIVQQSLGGNIGKKKNKTISKGIFVF
jgi:hypothetical protein